MEKKRDKCGYANVDGRISHNRLTKIKESSHKLFTIDFFFFHMNTSVQVSIIFPYFRTRSATEMLFPPLGAASLSAQLRRLNISVQIIDCTFLTYRQVQDLLRSSRSKIIGVYCMITMTENTFRLARWLRDALPDSLLVAGGPLPTLYPQRFSEAFDAVFRGESDLSFSYFCRDILRSNANCATFPTLPLHEYPGLYCGRSNPAVDNPVVHHSESELFGFPIPDRSGFDHVRYQTEWERKNGSRTTSLITTLGCPFHCDFCSKPVFGNTFRRRSIDAIMAEIREIRSFGYDSLWIADDNFTLDPKFLSSFCERVPGLGMRWSCLSRTTGITGDLARQMRQSGCRRVYLGLESGSSDTLRRMNKQASLEESVRAVTEFHAAGIGVAAFFIVGYPGETPEDVETTFRFALSLPLDDLSFNLPFPLPGSGLFRRIEGIDPTADWRVENELTFIYRSDFDQDWLRRGVARTLEKFRNRTGRRLSAPDPPERRTGSSPPTLAAGLISSEQESDL
jgi:anaerobic magnesium-protoporphyrin IX monomethyl ester cyclase